MQQTRQVGDLLKTDGNALSDGIGQTLNPQEECVAMPFLQFVSLSAVWAMLTFSATCGAHPGPHPAYALRIVGIFDHAGKPLRAAKEGQPFSLVLAIWDKERKRELSSSDLALAHERLFHLFTYDAGLANFRHEHPDENPKKPGQWVVAMTLPQAGQYRLWADVTLKSSEQHEGTHAGGQNLVLSQHFDVEGLSKPNAPRKELPPKLVGEDRNSLLTLKGADTLKAGEMAMPTIHFSRKDGTKPQLKPYLGAFAHFVVTDVTGGNLIHVHPMEMNGELMLHVTFPTAGDYRAFGQFIDGRDERDLKTVELNLRVR